MRRYTRLPNDALPVLATLTGAAPLTYVMLLSHRNNHSGQCNPSIGRLSVATGLTRRTVQRSLRELEAAGLIAADPQLGQGSRPTDYQFPPDSAKHGYTRLPNDALPVLAATNGAAPLVYFVLLSHRNNRGRCDPSIAALAADTRRNRRTVQRSLRELEAAGLIVTDPQTGRGYLPSSYRFPHIDGTNNAAGDPHPATEPARREPVAADTAESAPAPCEPGNHGPTKLIAGLVICRTCAHRVDEP